jgi:hypothetical protein
MANTVMYVMSVNDVSGGDTGLFWVLDLNAYSPVTSELPQSNTLDKAPFANTQVISSSSPISSPDSVSSDYSTAGGSWNTVSIKLMKVSPTRPKTLQQGSIYKVTIWGRDYTQLTPLTEAPGRVTISPAKGIPDNPSDMDRLNKKAQAPKGGSTNGSIPLTGTNPTIIRQGGSQTDHPSETPTAKTKSPQDVLLANKSASPVYDPAAPVKQPVILPITLPLSESQIYDASNYFRLGYAELLIPPKSITITTENGVVAVDIMRSQGDLNSVDFNTAQKIQIEFSSIGEEQYNAVVVPILQQYNRMPLLPVANTYLNSTWGIDALAINDVVISSLNGIPGGVSVTIVATPFNWKYYLPMNPSYEDSFCWPLFKAWCETQVNGKRNPNSLPSLKTLDSEMVFSIPNEASIKAKGVVHQPVPNTPVSGRGPSTSNFTANLSTGYTVNLGTGGSQKILDKDTATVLKARQNLENNAFRWDASGGSTVITFTASGQAYALIQLQSDRNILRALDSSTTQAYQSVSLKKTPTPSASLSIDNLSLSSPLSQAQKTDLMNLIGKSAKNQEFGASKSVASKLWLMIPENSAVWSYVWQALNISSTQTVNDTVDMDYLRFLDSSVISSVTVQFASHLATLQVEDTPLPRHQYLGGGDGFVSIQGMLDGEDEVNKLQTMLETVRRLGRHYRTMEWNIPYPGFLGIKNSFINSMGLLHFIPINLSVSTVDGFPHLYSYQLDLMEYSPTQERREEFDFMDKLIVQWSMSLATGKSQADIAKIMETNASNPDYLEKELGQFYQPLSKMNPLIMDINEGSLMRAWRTSLIDARLRMVEMYPDMCLPSKLQLDRWITILKNWGQTRALPSNPDDKAILQSMLPVIGDYDYNYNNIKEMRLSNDPMGYAEPDFFCRASIKASDWTASMISSNFGVELSSETASRPSAANAPKGSAKMLLTDQFGVQTIYTPGSPLTSATPLKESSQAYAKQQSDLKAVSSKITSARIAAHEYASGKYGNQPPTSEYYDSFWNLAPGTIMSAELGKLAPVWSGYPVIGTSSDPSYSTPNYSAIINSNPNLSNRVNSFLTRTSTPTSYNAKDLDANIVTPLLHMIKSNPRNWGVSREVADHLDSGLILGIILAESDGNINSDNHGAILTDHKGLMSVSAGEALGNLGVELKKYDGGQGPPLGLAPGGVRPATAYDALNPASTKGYSPYDPVANVLAGILLVASKMQTDLDGNPNDANVQANGVQGYRGIGYGSTDFAGLGYVNGVMAFASEWNNEYSSNSPMNNPGRSDPKNIALFQKTLDNAGIPKEEQARYIKMHNNGQIGYANILRYHLAQMARTFSLNEDDTSPWNIVLEKFFPEDGPKGEWRTIDGATPLPTVPCLPKGVTLYQDAVGAPNNVNLSQINPYPTEPSRGEKLWYGYTVYQDIPWTAFPCPNAQSIVDDKLMLYSSLPATLTPAPATAGVISMQYLPMFHDLQKKEYVQSLVGAFPAYLIQLVDGGEWIGVERLSDHFYGMSSVISISLVQTRKDPVDVATIAFSNLYNRLNSMAATIELQKMQDTRTTSTFQSWINGVSQFFSSEVSPDLESRREQWAKMLALRPGVRIHIRVGYGSDASQYPVRFNGVVSEVPTTTNVCEVIALGDGVELIKEASKSDGHWICDPIDSHQVWQNTGLFNWHGIEPRNIIAQLFSPSSALIETLSHARWETDNPYGITNFGNLDFHAYGSYNMGEIGVNLYESTQDPNNNSYAIENWYTICGSIAALHGQTLIGIEEESASPWSVAETCRMAVNDFILAVRPFEYRSTLFYGRDWFPFYYKYKYMTEDMYKEYNVPANWNTAPSDSGANPTFKVPINPYAPMDPFTPPLSESNQISFPDTVNLFQSSDPYYEKVMEQKAFSQFHVIATTHNLIASNITASSDGVITECQSKYIYGGVWGSTAVYGDIMRVDDDILPQFRRGETVQSGLLSGPGYGMEGLQRAFTWFTPINVVNHSANMYSAMTLRDSVADMYQGYNIIAGDPYIWPWDYVYLFDGARLMTGLYQVKEVVTQFSLETGYITLVSPDCLTGIASGMDTGVWMSLARFGQSMVSASTFLFAAGTIFRMLSRYGWKTKMLSWLAKRPEAIKNGVASKFEKIINASNNNPEAAAETTGVEGIDNLSGASKVTAGLGAKFTELKTKLSESAFGTKSVEYLKNLWDKTQGLGRNLYDEVSKHGVGSGAPPTPDTAPTASATSEATPPSPASATSEAPPTSPAPATPEPAPTSVSATSSQAAGEEAVQTTVEAATQTAEQTATRSTALAVIPVEASVAPEATEAAATVVKAAPAADPLTFIVDLTAIVLTSALGDMVGRWLSSKKCLVIMPLQVNGFEFSAGIEGHLGSVIGDPISVGDAWIASMFSYDYGVEHYGLLGAVVPLLLGAIFPGATMNNPENPSQSLGGEAFMANKIKTPDTDLWNTYVTALNNRVDASNFGLGNPQANYAYIVDSGTEPDSPASSTPPSPNNPNLSNASFNIPVANDKVDILDLNPLFAGYLSRFIRAVQNSDKSVTVTVTSGYRTYDQQLSIWERHGEDTQVAAHPGVSAHEFGFAADLSVSPNTAANWELVHSMAAKYNLWFPVVKTDIVHVELAYPSVAPFASSLSSVGFDRWLSTRRQQWGR